MMKLRVTRFLAFLCSLCMLIGSTAPMAKQQNALLAYAFGEQTQVDETKTEMMEGEAEKSGYATAGDGDTVSRVEWVSELTQLFEMTVEEDNYPDNYYSDIDSSSEYYYDVMLATEFGMVEVETGEQFCPDDPATREFAAHTLNFCLGYVLDEQEYTFNEAEEVTYADDIQIAVNQGWFELTDGAFLPEQALTTEEADALLLVASDAIAATEINPEDSSYSLKDSVIIIPEELEKEMVSETELAFYDLDVALETGDMFAVLDGGFPYVKKAETVSTEGNKTTVIVTDVELNEAFDEYNVQGEISADLAEIQAYSDDVQMTYLVGGTPEENFADGTEYETLEEVGEMEISAVNARVTYAIPESVRKEFNLAPGVKAVLTCTISGVQVNHKSTTGTAQATASARVTFTCNVSMNVLEAIGASKSVELVKVPVGWGVFITLSLDLSLKGELTVALVEYVSAGFSFSNGSFRLLHSFYKESFTVTAKAEASVGLTLSATLDLAVFKASLYGKAGIKAVASTAIHGEGSPTRCTQVNAWMYAAIGASVKLNLVVYKNSWGKEITLYNQWNSPVRVAFHFEDGVAVPVCSRDSSVSSTSQSGSSQYKYYTPITSRYGYSGANSGVDAYGEPFTLFDYTEGEEGITITGYRGNVSALNIPETLDGHTVVGLGGYLFENNKDLRIVIIPDTVTRIDNYAFSGCINLESVTLPEEMEYIGICAFEDCEKLQSIDLPDGIEAIEGSAFRNCSSLTEFVIPDSVTKIGWSAFENCMALSEVTLSKNLISLEGEAFGNCDALTSIHIPKSLEDGGSGGSISEYGAFQECDGLKEVTFEEGITRIADRLFYKCTGLESIRIPDTVTTIEVYAFESCINLKEVILSDNLTSIDGSAFFGCTELTKIEIPDSVTEIGWSAFANCIKLSEVTLSKRLVSLGGEAFGDCDVLSAIHIPKSLELGGGHGSLNGYGAFQNCDGLKEVTFEEGITRVAELLFYNCTGLEKIEIPNTVTIIGPYSFGNCTKLKDIILPSSLTQIEYCAFEGCTGLTELDLPKALKKIAGSAFAACSKLTEIKIPDSVTEIGGSAFANCTNLETVTLSKKLHTLGGEAFSNCDALQKIEIPKSLDTAGDTGIWRVYGVFENCDGLKEVTFEEGTTHVAGRLFAHCPGLEKIEVPDTVTEIGAHAFYDCANLAEVLLPKSLAIIKSCAFEECKSLEDIVFPDSLLEIGDTAFKNCITLETVILPKGLTKISDSTFDGNASLREVQIFEGLTEIGNYAFRNCKVLESIEIPNTVKSLGSELFYNCDALTSITIPNSVTSLGSYCFYSCDSLAEIDFGTGLTEIPSYAFDQCGKLTSIVLPYRLTKIQDHAFTNNPLLLDITIPRSVTTISSTAFNYYDDITIYGLAGSYAETYAEELGATFVAQDIPAESVQLNKTELTLNRYKTETLYITIEPDNFTDTVTWKSSNTNIVTVNEKGEVYAVAPGTATIRVTVGKKSASCKVTVLQPVTSISLNKTSLTMATNDTFTLVATVNPENANDKSVEWTSSDESVATVTQDGLVTAVGKGTATITVTAKDGSNVSRGCTVNVTRCNYICTTVEELESTHDYEDDCTDSWTYTLGGAAYLKVTFDEATMIEDEFDFLYLYDGEENLVGEYTGAALAGQTITVPGDTVVIQLNTDSAGTEWGFKVTEVISDLEAGEGVTDFVSRLYTVILGREADEDGLNSWVSQLTSRTKTGVDVTEGFILSKEFIEKELTDEAFVLTMYRAFFNREADEEGLTTWLGYLEEGYVKEYIFARFAGSDEFADLCAGYGITRGEAELSLAVQTPHANEQEFQVWQFLDPYYQQVLGRDADYDGLKGWADKLLTGTHSGVEVAEGFFLSEEFQNADMSATAYVNTLYRAFFNRPADEGGLEKWTGRLAEGYVKKHVFGGLAVSDEFEELCAGYGIERGEVYLTLAEQTAGLTEREFNVWQFVERLYMEVLDRKPDYDGLVGWANNLLNNEKSGAEVARGFILSKEFLEKDMTNEEFVRIMYKAFFGREADTAGLTSWIDRMANGETEEQVFAGFVDSEEFGVLCDSFGITQGSVPMPER